MLRSLEGEVGTPVKMGLNQGLCEVSLMSRKDVTVLRGGGVNTSQDESEPGSFCH